MDLFVTARAFPISVPVESSTTTLAMFTRAAGLTPGIWPPSPIIVKRFFKVLAFVPRLPHPARQSAAINDMVISLFMSTPEV